MNVMCDTDTLDYQERLLWSYHLPLETYPKMYHTTCMAARAGFRNGLRMRWRLWLISSSRRWATTW